jgi:predicted O-linked N-acetylglucosamine transferase (SPINDLY family)
MGLPVLTRQGESFASRVASSLLQALDMNDLICTTQTDYEARAIALGVDPSAHTSIKQRLLQNKAKSELFDARAYTRDLESIYAKLLAIC